MNFLHSALANAAGWALLHSLWQGALVALVLALTMHAMRSPQARYACACGALLTILVCFAWTFERFAAVGSSSPVNPPPGPVQLTGLAAVTGPVAFANFDSLVPWLSILWLTGVGLSQVWHLAGWYAAGRLRRRGVCAASPAWQARLVELRGALRVSRPVQLFESCLVTAPVVLGHLRPLILMPAGMLAGLPAAYLDAILMHELAHVRRADYLVNILQRLVEGVLFYHPAVWWISRVIRAEREHCCDDAAVAWSGDAHAYASALAELEANRQFGLALAATGGSLTMRIQRLLYPPKRAAGGWGAMAAALALLMAGALLLPAWQAKPDDPEIEGAFRAWMNQDVVYIITPPEREAFLKLSTNSERAKFVEEFWLRRDPTPGTPQNEMMEEHYRRLAYSNQRFAGTKAGWATDRGRVYIQYGPPDEIESHPSETTPYEEWKYRYLGGIGDNVIVKFVKHDGEYQWTRDKEK